MLLVLGERRPLAAVVLIKHSVARLTFVLAGNGRASGKHGAIDDSTLDDARDYQRLIASEASSDRRDLIAT